MEFARAVRALLLAGSGLALPPFLAACGSAAVTAVREAVPAPVLAAGPMVGFVGPTRARIWVQGRTPGWVACEVSTDGRVWSPARHHDGRAARVHLHADEDFAGVCEVPGLTPATLYRYRIVGEDGVFAAASEQSFRTPPPPGAAEDLLVGFGSCAGDWGRDPSQPVWRAIDALHPDLFLWLGDDVYFRLQEREWLDPAAMAARWRTQRALPALQPLLRRTSQVAIWDDHDFGPNDADKTFAGKDRALELFVRYWANPGFGSGGEAGVWCRVRRGRVEFFLLDGRFHRDPIAQEPDAFKTQFGETQWRWLEAALAASDADFKVIVSPTQVLADYHSFEGWWAYPADRTRLLELIRRERIEGVLLLSGDRHIGEVLVGEALPYPLYELCSSPLAAGIGEHPPAELPGRVPGTLVTEENFGLLRFEFGGPEGPRFRYQAHDVAGQALHVELCVPLSALRFPG